MNVSLTPTLEQWINEKVQSGFYSSASELVREALRLLHEQEYYKELRVEMLRKEIIMGIRDLDIGKSHPFDTTTVNRIKETGRKKLNGFNS